MRERLPWAWWRQVGRGLFEIEGVPDAMLREFSRRRIEIEERAFELTGVAASQLSRQRIQGIALATRKAKEYGVDGARCAAKRKPEPRSTGSANGNSSAWRPIRRESRRCLRLRWSGRLASACQGRAV